MGTRPFSSSFFPRNMWDLRVCERPRKEGIVCALNLRAGKLGKKGGHPPSPSIRSTLPKEKLFYLVFFCWKKFRPGLPLLGE